MEVLSEMPSATVIPLNKIFRIDQIDSSLKYQQNQVKNWLKKNLIPVVVNGDILQIENLEIHPPYGPNQCFSSNPIVLSRIQNLLMLMVQENH